MRRSEERILDMLFRELNIVKGTDNHLGKDDDGGLVCKTPEKTIRIAGGQVTVDGEDAKYQIEFLSSETVGLVKLYCGPIGTKVQHFNDAEEKVYLMARERKKVV